MVLMGILNGREDLGVMICAGNRDGSYEDVRLRWASARW
jgi:hypothetical protein